MLICRRCLRIDVIESACRRARPRDGVATRRRRAPLSPLSPHWTSGILHSLVSSALLPVSCVIVCITAFDDQSVLSMPSLCVGVCADQHSSPPPPNSMRIYANHPASPNSCASQLLQSSPMALPVVLARMRDAQPHPLLCPSRLQCNACTPRCARPRPHNLLTVESLPYCLCDPRSSRRARREHVCRCHPYQTHAHVNAKTKTLANHSQCEPHGGRSHTLEQHIFVVRPTHRSGLNTACTLWWAHKQRTMRTLGAHPASSESVRLRAAVAR